MNEIDYRPMVEPAYGKWPARQKVKLSGRVLAFGAGQLLHEQKLFDLSDVEELIAYDPFVILDTSRLPPELLGCAVYRNIWSEALKAGPFNDILCLFSLHYEPRWLITLVEILEQLEPGGRLYFCEDAGFRAILDGSPKNLPQVPQIAEAFHDRLMREVAAPWIPDFSASDASLLQEVLALFGGTRKVSSVRVRRTAYPAAEPDCYLPWNRDRSDIPDDLVDSVRRAIAAQESIEETIELYEFTRDTSLRLADIFDLADPRARLLWRAVGDRAARALGRLIVSRTGAKRADNDFSFRKGALALLYQNILRHFSFWRGAELVVGALNPEFEKDKGADLEQYQFTCLSPSEIPCFWGAKFDPPHWLEEYRRQIEESKQGWVGKALYECGRGGVYCWPGPGVAFHEDESWRVIDDRDPLHAAFADRKTPPCIYIIDPLATLDDLVVSSEKHLLYGALIIYLRDDLSGPVERELRCLLFMIESSRAIVVGRAGFLELELLQENARNSEAIQEPLRKLRDHQQALRETSNAVELLASRLDPMFESPGQVFLEQLGRTLDAALFGGEFHEPRRHTLPRLIPVVFSPDVQKLMRDIARELEFHGVESTITQKLFTPLTPERIVQNAEGAATLAKTLTRPHALPLLWVRAALRDEESAEDFRKYIGIASAGSGWISGQAITPISAFMAFCHARSISHGRPPCGIEEGDSLHCTWIMRPDRRGADGLNKLEDLLRRPDGAPWPAGEHVGLTTRSLRRLKELAGTPNFSATRAGNLTIRATFKLIIL